MKFSFMVMLLLLPVSSGAQDTVRAMSYNLLAYSDSLRDSHFRKILQSINPDLLVVQEIDSITAIPNFLHNVLNAYGESNYQVGILIDGPDSDNALFYRISKFDFIGTRAIHTPLRDINEFLVVHKGTGIPLRIFGVHLDAGISDSADRTVEAEVLRSYLDQLPEGVDFMIAGDFNIYGSSESAYGALTNAASGSGGHVVDPLHMSGVWNDAGFAPFHTQSTRVRAFGGGATGGLDDRFDMILLSPSVAKPGGISLLPESYRAFGNDGFHYNDSINRPPNPSVSEEIATALHEASDHLPVVADFLFEGPVSVFSPSIEQEAEVKVENFPNPFNPSTTINVTIPEAVRTSLKVYDILGREVVTIIDAKLNPGTYSYEWNGTNKAGLQVSSGVYFYRLDAGSFVQTRKMILLK